MQPNLTLLQYPISFSSRISFLKRKPSEERENITISIMSSHLWSPEGLFDKFSAAIKTSLSEEELQRVENARTEIELCRLLLESPAIRNNPLFEEVSEP